jgi:hypothetical protein
MTTLPDDYARCQGVSVFSDEGWLTGTPIWQPKRECRDCLRRTAPMRDNVLYSYMAPPEFTTTCPERIAP